MGRKTSAITWIPLWASLGIIALAGSAIAQDQTPRPWRSVNDPPPAGVDAAPPPDAPSSGFDQGAAPADQQSAQQGAPQQQPNFQGAPPPQGPGPAHTVASSSPADHPLAGSFVSVRINGWLSSDRNHQGDSFTATLDQPSWSMASWSRSADRPSLDALPGPKKPDASRAPRKSASQPTDSTLVDGQTVQVRSQMIDRNGPTSVGRDVGSRCLHHRVGAAIGAGVGWAEARRLAREQVPRPVFSASF